MSALKVEFVKSATNIKDYPKPDKPEIAIVGRSNVGKSSLLNAIFKRSIAKVSAKPGKTRLINFFSFNDKIYFVDLPGYGFASVSKAEKEKWQKMIEEYLLNRENLKYVIMLVDSRHPPTSLDKLMKDWLESFGLNYIVVATKADKLNQSEKAKTTKIIREELNLDKDKPVFLTSAKEGTGIKELLSYIFESLEKEND
ncbi:ribosome biogenesis GTP-binding protein YihA/YsxC [Venenivibrio stagnispumantis]|uniref:Probable GTP-binding protein EngB n=1 Tax=Venenivibrio stagnispumantis TaxID=407998 RepID=A0AA45WK16_9AQUI|nr:ribosome biogenesis GTP-binding protein YihA/YsxC [Venenivibrio stagnispumantis]MCW4572957.1 ribosome biogenesis GTP-binding protein YihA/YsxC [Venenivibrio stagnispumantis]SMP05170.1 GTP-binding protein [Venenivibrio stagnispumantis]